MNIFRIAIVGFMVAFQSCTFGLSADIDRNFLERSIANAELMSFSSHEDLGKAIGSKYRKQIRARLDQFGAIRQVSMLASTNSRWQWQSRPGNPFTTSKPDRLNFEVSSRNRGYLCKRNRPRSDVQNILRCL